MEFSPTLCRHAGWLRVKVRTKAAVGAPVRVFIGGILLCGRVDVSFAPFELRSHTSALKLALMSVFEYRKSVLSVLKVSRLVSFVPTTLARLLTRPISI